MVSSLMVDASSLLAVCASIGGMEKERERKVTPTFSSPDIVKLSSPDRRGPKTILRGNFRGFIENSYANPLVVAPTCAQYEYACACTYAAARGLHRAWRYCLILPRGVDIQGCISTWCRNWMSLERGTRIGSERYLSLLFLSSPYCNWRF